MAERWQTSIIVELRILGITQKQFAKECGYSEPYMSQLLRCRKDTPQSKENILFTLERLKYERTQGK